jgi:hypothetical protein
LVLEAQSRVIFVVVVLAIKPKQSDIDLRLSPQIFALGCGFSRRFIVKKIWIMNGID